MKTVAIMQPAYLPWLGYFDLMDQADVFVILDTAQFSHQSWQHRNRIRTRQGLTWLTIPVLDKGRSGQSIADVEILPGRDLAKTHGRTLRQSYAHAPYVEPLVSDCEDILRRAHKGGRLTDVTIPLIELIRASLGISTPCILSSTMTAHGTRSERLTDIARELRADSYISPEGARTYLIEDRQTFLNAEIGVQIQRYEHPAYVQQFRPFLSHASSVDLLFNSGPEALETLRSGRRNPLSLGAAAT